MNYKRMWNKLKIQIEKEKRSQYNYSFFQNIKFSYNEMLKMIEEITDKIEMDEIIIREKELEKGEKEWLKNQNFSKKSKDWAPNFH